MTNFVLVEIKDNYNTYQEALDHLKSQNVEHLGWLNSGIKVPTYLNCVTVFKNYSGSSTLCVDRIHRIAYSVDMGD